MHISIRSLILASLTFALVACSGSPEVENSGSAAKLSSPGVSTYSWSRPESMGSGSSSEAEKAKITEKEIQAAEEAYLKNLKALKSNTILPVSTILAGVLDHSNTKSMDIYEQYQDEANKSLDAVMSAEIESAFESTDIETACCGQENPRLSVCFKEQMEELNEAIKAIEKDKALEGAKLHGVEFRVLDNTTASIKDEKQTLVLREFLKHAKYRQTSRNKELAVSYELSVNTLSNNHSRETAFGEMIAMKGDKNGSLLRMTYILNDDPRLEKGCHPVRKDNIVSLLKKGLAN